MLQEMFSKKNENFAEILTPLLIFFAIAKIPLGV